MKTSPIKRFAISIALMAPIGIFVSLVNEWMAFSDGVSFLTLAAAGTICSMIVLHGSPLSRRRHPRRRQGRHV